MRHHMSDRLPESFSLAFMLPKQGGEALYSQQKQDRELTVAQVMNSLLRLKQKKVGKFRLKQKKVGKTARPFRYDLNQIP